MPNPSYTRFGDPLNNLVESPDSPRVEFMADGVVMITRKWKCDSGSDIALAPKPKALDALGYSARCVSTVIQHGAANISEIVSTYQGYVTLPPNIYEFANSRFDRPIQMHPQFMNNSVFPTSTKYIPTATGMFEKFKDVGSVADTKFRGVEAYITGSAQWRKTSYSLQPDLEQTDVGKLSAPEVGSYTGVPDASNAGKSWLKVEKTTVNMLKGASIMWVTTEVWQYNVDKWLTEIYGP